MKKRQPLSFYIINDQIYYSTINGGLDHAKLWELIVDQVFKKLDPLNKNELKNHPYGAERGRLVWNGDEDRGNPKESSKGNYVLYGSKGCEKYKDKLISIFKLKPLENTVKLVVDFKSDPHYKTIAYDTTVLKDMLDITKGTYHLEHTHVAKVKKIAKKLLKTKYKTIIH